MGESEHGDGRRGASPPANPCFFVEGHHAIGPGRAFGGAGVVLRRPQTLVSSSRGTTSDGRIGVRNRMAWCLIARKPLFLRRGTPRHWPWSSLRMSRRGASPPASPCFFVEGHHAIGPDRAFGRAGVMLHCPLSLVSSSPGTTPLISSNRTIPGTRPGFPEFPSFPKKRKMSARCCSRSTLPTFHLSPYQSEETVLFAY